MTGCLSHVDVLSFTPTREPFAAKEEIQRRDPFDSFWGEDLSGQELEEERLNYWLDLNA